MKYLLRGLAAIALLLTLTVVGFAAMLNYKPNLFPFRVGYLDSGWSNSCVLVRFDYPGPFVRPWMWIHKPLYWMKIGVYDIVPTNPSPTPPPPIQMGFR